MKKLLAILLSVILVLSFAACTGKTNSTSNSLEASSNSNSSEIVSNDNSSVESSSDAEWKQFLKDYEAWVDDYIEILEKYKKNPTDMTILSDYADMMSKTTEWSAKADKIQGELAASPEALKEYTQTLSRIIDKLTKAAY